MILFLISAGLLLIAALAIVLFPLLRTRPTAQGGADESSAMSLDILREQLRDLEERAVQGDSAEYEAERAEIERRALEEASSSKISGEKVNQAPRRWLAVAVAVSICAVSVGLYLWLGEPDALRPESRTVAEQAAHAVTPEQIMGMVAKLAERLQENPNDPDGWVMLARSYNALGRYAEASAAFGRASMLVPDNAQVLSDYADTLAMAQGRSLLGAPEAIIERALQVDPRNIKALALSGSAAFERGNYAAAVTEWRKILGLVPPESSLAGQINNSIADAQSRISGTAPDRGPAAASSAASVTGSVSISPELRRTTSDSDTVFVFARASGARPSMPLAVLRTTVGELPRSFELNDAMAMPRGAKLSSARQVIVGARVSKTGNAIVQSGDLEGYSSVVDVGATGVTVEISRKVP